jgi:hypothetical protein
MRRAWLIAIVALITVGTLAGAILMTTRPGDPALFPAKPGESRVAVFVVHNGFHSELAIPTAVMRRQGGASARALDKFEPSPWVLVGWGDARFYMQAGWSRARVADGLRALWPDNPSVIRMTPIPTDPDRAFENGLVRLELSPRGAARMLERLDRSLRLAGGEAVTVTSPEADGAATYFESVERFSLLKLCNNWTGELLNAAGVPTTTALHVMPQGLLLDLRLRSHAAPRPNRRLSAEHLAAPDALRR